MFRTGLQRTHCLGDVLSARSVSGRWLTAPASVSAQRRGRPKIPVSGNACRAASQSGATGKTCLRREAPVNFPAQSLFVTGTEAQQGAAGLAQRGRTLPRVGRLLQGAGSSSLDCVLGSFPRAPRARRPRPAPSARTQGGSYGSFSETENRDPNRSGTKTREEAGRACERCSQAAASSAAVTRGQRPPGDRRGPVGSS